MAQCHRGACPLGEAMSRTTTAYPFLRLLSLTLLLQLAACGRADPPAPRAAEAPDATSQAATAEPAAMQRPRCADDGTVPLPATAIGGGNQLHRSGEPDLLSILSLKADSRAWETKCPVPLVYRPFAEVPGCHVEDVLPRPARLSIRHIENSDRYTLKIEPMPGHSGRTLERTLTPVLAPADDRKHVTWLVGPADEHLAADLYVHLADTRGSQSGTPHKRYVIEAFARGEKHCDAHLPHLSSCQSEDFPAREPCHPDLRPRADSGFGTRQTDTGTGNEPPAV